MKECILKCVNSLPKTSRTDLVLSEFDDFCNNVIADILGITVGIIKIRLHHAREKLQQALATNCGSEWVEVNVFVPKLKRLDIEASKQD